MDTRALPRIAAFDHVRAIAVLCMIISHVALMFGSNEAAATPIGRFMNDFCGTAPAAPVFMLLMGIFFLYPKDKPFAVKFIRGMKLFTLDLVLNIVRMVIPFWILMRFAPAEFERMASMLQVTREQVFWRIFYNMDILGFAGIAYMLLALLQLVARATWHWILVGIVVVVAAPFLWGLGENLGPVFYLFQPLWGRPLIENVPTDTAFPAFPWLVYPLTGLIIGRFLLDGGKEPEIGNRMFLAGLGSAIISAVLIGVFGMKQFGDYYRMYAGGTFFVLSFALLWVSLFLWLARKGWLQGLLPRLTFWSEHITLVYCVQWFFFGFSVVFLHFRRIDEPWILVAMTPCFFLATWAVSRLLLNSPRFMAGFRWFTR